jgi:gliding motility-associated-like protein
MTLLIRGQYTILTAMAVLCYQLAFAQNVSNSGKEFWTGYGHHQFMEPGMGNSQQMALHISAKEAATVTVSIFGTAWVRTYNIPANTTITTEYIPKAGLYDARLYSPPPAFGGTGAEGIFTNKGIHVESNVPVVVNAQIFGSASSGATMLLPVETWGYSYISLNSTQYYADNSFSWMYIVAKENNTVVEITPSTPSRNGRAAGVPFAVTLNKGDIYQVLGASQGAGRGYDLTGTKVRAVANAGGQCLPFAMFSGSSRTYISCPGGLPGGGDNIFQQAFAEQAWGRRYLTAPFSANSGASARQTNIFRVLVKNPATVVRRNGVVLSPLVQNAYYEFQSNTADLIEADQPIMLAQYMASSGGCPDMGSLGDPEMVYVSPADQGIWNTSFFRTNAESIDVNYLTLVVPTAGLSSLQIDGGNTFDNVYTHPQDAAYSVVVKRWNAGRAQSTVSCDHPFTGITYGEGSVESYGYNVGVRMNNLHGIGSVRNAGSTEDKSSVCAGTPLHFSMLLPYRPSKLSWDPGSAGPVINPSPGVIDQLSPTEEGTEVVEGLTYYRYTLPTDFTFNTPGDYYIPVTATSSSVLNCNQTETIHIPVHVLQGPAAQISVSQPSACTLDTVYFEAAIIGNGYTPNEWDWTFPDASTATGSHAAKVFPPGTHQVQVKIGTAEGCVASASRQVVVEDKPLASFNVSSPEICQGGQVTFTDNSPSPATAWYYDFGNGSSTDLAANDPQTVTYEGAGTYEVKFVAKQTALCISDTVAATIRVYASPVIAPGVPDNCLPVGGMASFTSNASTPDGQTISSYHWDFGDGSGTAGTKDASYQYAAGGTYQVRLSVQTANGCTTDSTVDVKIAYQPQLAYSAVPATCESLTPINIAYAAVTNSVPGTGHYSGTGIDAAGSFTPAVPGLHAAKYTFTTTDGCIDSVSASIRVWEQPAITLSVPSGCLPAGGMVTFTSNALTTDGQAIGGYTWDFGDGSPIATVKDPQHSYTQTDGYTVAYTATTVNGCTKDTSFRVSFGERPQLSFGTVPPICEEQSSPVSVAYARVENGVSGSGVYAGTGIDAAGFFSSAGVAAGTYPVKYVFTTGDGCIDSVESTFEVSPSPVAAFRASADTVYQNAALQLTDMSTGGVNSWEWDLGDGTSAFVANPTKSYPAAGVYNISLRVSNPLSCVSSPYSLPVVVLAAPVAGAIRPPNAFSPNGDGINDTWVIAGLAQYPDCIVEVFNRYGQKVFRSNGYGSSWNGTLNGAALPIGTYYYVIQLRNGDKPLSGSITILK